MVQLQCSEAASYETTIKTESIAKSSFHTDNSAPPRTRILKKLWSADRPRKVFYQQTCCWSEKHERPKLKSQLL